MFEIVNRFNQMLDIDDKFRVFQIPNNFLGIVELIHSILGLVLMVLYFYQNFYAIFGAVTKKKKYNKAKKLHKYAYIICAHDEETVVGNLVDSIYKQDYPRELMQVFVVADNCTDNTANVARDAGAIVFERTSSKKGKSFALDFVIKKLLKDYKSEGFEAAFIFDADNLVNHEYTLKMNDLFDQGIRVATSYRESKNYDENWVSASSSMLFYREAVLIHHSRARLNVGTYVSGTGYYVDWKILEDLNGWNFHTLVEDIEFSYYCCANDIKIGFCEDALFYDEQPIDLKSNNIQKLRWCKGIHQCFAKYELKCGGWKLRRDYLKKKEKVTLRDRLFSQTRYEMHMHISPLPSISALWTVFFALISGIYCIINQLEFKVYLNYVMLPIIYLIGGCFGLAFLHALIVTLKKHKQIQASLFKQILYCFTFPVLVVFMLCTSIKAMFKREVKWVKIDHVEDKKIEDMKDVDEEIS